MKVKMIKKGNAYFGLCPFHKEKNPSFSVNVKENIIHCFGCGWGDDLQFHRFDDKTSELFISENINE